MAAPKRKTSKPSKPSGARILVVEARFYDAISDALLEPGPINTANGPW